MQAWLAYYYYRAAKADQAEQIRLRLAGVRDSMINLGQVAAGETALLGFMAYSAEDYEEALSLLDEARQVVRGFDDYRWFPLEYFTALTLYRMGNLGEAVEQFRNAMNCYDIDRAYHIARAVLTHYWLGRTYEESGWHQQAIEQYETFLDTWKDADSGIEEVEDARARLSRLRADV
jgi:tetratricopeptide (TPR) repeat protein